MGVLLRNESASALGTFRFTWRSADGSRCQIWWSAGLPGPLAQWASDQPVVVRYPWRFGFRHPVTAASFRRFVQAFADEFEAAK